MNTQNSDFSPKFSYTAELLALCVEITRLLEQLRGQQNPASNLRLRKASRIKTVYGSCKIEGNELTLEEVTTHLNGHRVLGPRKDVQEVLNAAKAYDGLPKLESTSIGSQLKAHRTLMAGLIQEE